MGRMCSKCEQRWFRAGGECKRCPKGAPVILYLFVAFSVLIDVLLVKFGGRRSAKAYGGTVGIATKFFQVLSVIAGRVVAELRQGHDHHPDHPVFAQI